MKASDIPTRFPIAFASSASGSYVRTIPVSSQIGIQDGAASLETGFPPLNFLPLGSGGVPPFGQDMNGILKEISQWTRWGNAGGPVPWDSTYATQIGGYPAGALVASATTAALFWYCTTDDNTSNPDSGGSGWTRVTFVTAAGQIWHIGSATGGTSSALTTTLSPTVQTTDTNFFFAAPITTTNTLSGGATTINWGAGAKTIVDDVTGANVAAGALPGGVDYVAQFFYDGTYARLFNVQQPVSLLHYGATSGTNTLTATVSPAINAYVDGLVLEITPSNNNTGAVTINANGVGAVSIVDRLGSALTADALVANQPTLISYIGSSFQLLTPNVPTAPGVIVPKIYAWGNIDNYSGTPSLVNGSGVLSLSSFVVGTGTVITITLTNSMPDIDYTAIFSVVSYNSGNNAMAIQETYGSRAVNRLEIIMSAPSISSNTPTRCSFMIYHT